MTNQSGDATNRGDAMSDITRWKVSGPATRLQPDADGPWVALVDYYRVIDRLIAERDEARAEVERLKEQVAALTLAVEQADEAKADAEAAAAREEAETDRVVADGNRALAEVDRLTIELNDTREKLARVQVQYDEFAKVTAKVIDQHQRERDHARQQVYLLQQAGADRPSDEDIWREAYMSQLHDRYWASSELADVALAEYRKRWPR